MTALSSCWFQENDVDGSSWHLPRLLIAALEFWTNPCKEPSGDPGQQLQFKFGTFFSINIWTATDFQVYYALQTNSHFLLVHIKARSYDSRAARDLVVWVVTLRTSYNLSPLGIRMHRLTVIIMHVCSFVAVPLSCNNHFKWVILNIAKLSP